jgi:gluconate 2-dehydrogenase subunit 3-like protein
MDCRGLYFGDNATEKEIVMSNDVRNEPLPGVNDNGPLRHFRAGRRAVLQSLAGVGAVAFASAASAAHVHQAAATAAKPADSATTGTADSALLFLDRHSFDTLAILGEQIVPGSRAVQVPEFLDRLLAVESTETQKRFTQALGAFEREAREAHGMPWKALTTEQAMTLLTKISGQPDSDVSRHAFDGIKGAVAETYYSSEAGMKELGWNGSVAFAAPIACG